MYSSVYQLEILFLELFEILTKSKFLARVYKITPPSKVQCLCPLPLLPLPLLSPSATGGFLLPRGNGRVCQGASSNQLIQNT